MGEIAASRVHFIWLDESRRILCRHILYEVWYQWRKKDLKLGAYFAPVDLFWKDCSSFFHQELSGANLENLGAKMHKAPLHFWHWHCTSWIWSIIFGFLNVNVPECCSVCFKLTKHNIKCFYNNVNRGDSLKFFGYVRGNRIQDYIFPHILKGFAMPPWQATVYYQSTGLLMAPKHSFILHIQTRPFVRVSLSESRWHLLIFSWQMLSNTLKCTGKSHTPCNVCVKTQNGR